MTSLEKEQFQEWKKENNAEYSKLAGLIKQFDSSEPIINVNTSMAWQRIDANWNHIQSLRLRLWLLK